MLLTAALNISAQQMRMERFSKTKKGPFNMKHIKTDKQLATLDVRTGEKGFKFLANGKEEVQAEPGEQRYSVECDVDDTVADNHG